MAVSALDVEIKSGVRTFYNMAGNANQEGNNGKRGSSDSDRRREEHILEVSSVVTCHVKKDLEDHAIHLLFSANRWELLPKILSELKSGTSIIVDRYAFSGVAFLLQRRSLEDGPYKSMILGKLRVHNRGPRYIDS
ncbi:uncharacterized protein LOC119589594 [Penaeus monodon]|uniref:uncharacterized protein LOC119589594 n=1 Tax=Penaeus monodon TaxID=6687 RepID=UPI0018A707EF|nr:uncharacterized protein LOC119589594 [Penaeus monodon]